MSAATTTARTITRTGLVIGGAYVRPPPAPSADAERLQAALLEPRPDQVLGSAGALRVLTDREHDHRTLAARSRWTGFFRRLALVSWMSTTNRSRP